MPQLLIMRDGELLSRIPLEPRTVVGRGMDADLLVVDKKVSRTQCVIEQRGGSWFVADRSGRGTQVNNRTVTLNGAALSDGDALVLGAYLGVFDMARRQPSSNIEVTQLTERTGKTRKLTPKHIARRGVIQFTTSTGERRIPLRAEEGFSVIFGTAPKSKSGSVLVELEDASVTGQHLRVTYGKRQWLLEDIGSTNGTWLDGVRVIKAPLPRKAAIRLGETTLLFEEEATPGDDEGATPLPGLVSEDPMMKPVVDFVRRVASSPISVLIHGESGTGKEVIARALHQLSPRSTAPFVALNCGALPKETLESELFGHEKGAFTGADKARAGAFEQADGGTLFLDEIGDLPLHAQVKLLRTLETGEVRRMGAQKILQTDVRVVSASHKDLQAMVANGAFREDLYYRLCVAPLELPPLRRRVLDIMPLVKHFARQFGTDESVVFSPTAQARLQSHGWPGNAREVRNVVQLALLQRRGPVITEEDFVFRKPISKGKQDAVRLSGLTIDEIERTAYRLAMQRHDNDKKAAMEELGVARSTFFRKLEEFGLTGR